MSAVSHTRDQLLAFEYEPLDPTSRDFRLVKINPSDKDPDAPIHLTIAHADLDSVPSFSALSYEWGPLDDGYPIRIGCKVLLVRRNLKEFLFQARLDPNLCVSWLWIDSICIDQQSKQEKSHQVAQMGRIYQKASRALIWIPTSEHAGASPLSHNALVRCVLQNTYWSRLWIIQEVLLAHTPIIITSQRHISWSELCSTYELLLFEPGLALTIPHFERIHAHRQSNKKSIQYTVSSWRRACELSQGSVCTDDRDKVFGMLGLVAKEIRVEPDYRLPAKVVFIKTIVAELLRSPWAETIWTAVDDREERSVLTETFNDLDNFYRGLSGMLNLQWVQNYDLFPTLSILSNWIRAMENASDEAYPSADQWFWFMVHRGFKQQVLIRGPQYALQYWDIFVTTCFMVGIDATMLESTVKAAVKRAARRVIDEVMPREKSDRGSRVIISSSPDVCQQHWSEPVYWLMNCFADQVPGFRDSVIAVQTSSEWFSNFSGPDNGLFLDPMRHLKRVEDWYLHRMHADIQD